MSKSSTRCELSRLAPASPLSSLTLSPCVPFLQVPVEKVVEVEKLVGMREEDVEQLKRSIQTEAEAERLKIIRQKEQLVAARAKQETALQSEVERHKTEQSERERIKAELDSLESKVMHGGEHVRDRVAKRQAQIAEQQRMLEDRKAEEVTANN